MADTQSKINSDNLDIEVTNTIGYNIKDIRRNRKPEKFTVKYMVSEINKLLPGDSKITEGLYYKWESEERIPTAKQIPAIAKVLGVTETSLFHWQERKRGIRIANSEDFSEELMALDMRRLEKLIWIVVNWCGDADALIEFAVLYINLLVTDRKYIASFGIRLYDVCNKEGKLRINYPKPDIEYLKDALILKNEKSSYVHE